MQRLVNIASVFSWELCPENTSIGQAGLVLDLAGFIDTLVSWTYWFSGLALFESNNFCHSAE